MKKLEQILLTTSLAALAGASSCNIILTSGSNYDTIDSHAARSGQVTPSRLDSYSKRQKPKTIINLRGENEGEDWYDTEKAYCESHNITLLDVRTRGSRLPKKEEILDVINAIKTAERPVLFHCKGGADRTGMATTIYLHLEQNMPIKKAAEKGCTYYHGNLHSYQRDFFKMYEPYEDNMEFETWVKDVYKKTKK